MRLPIIPPAELSSEQKPLYDDMREGIARNFQGFINARDDGALLRASGAAWLIATTFPEWQTNADCEDGDWRALNFERAPFGWGPPVELVNENCTEAGGGWRDKSLGVWRLEEIGKPSLREA